jgi:ABC-type transport system substrate-binding protein
MADSYWNTVLGSRLSRRRALAATGGAAAAAAFLAACGGSDSGGSKGQKDASGLLSQPVNTMAKATRGGTWPTTITADPPHFDSIGKYHTAAYAQNLMSYSVLADFKTTEVKAEGETYPLWGYEAEGAESWEFSPDGLQLTWKLRPGMKTDPRAPTNGRVYDSSDLEFSWKKFAGLNARRSDLLNEINANAPVISTNYPDKQTMVMKLAFPSPVLMQKINRFLMLTKEGDASPNGYDPLRDMRGTGPWMMSSYEPSVRITYEKNLNYWNAKNFPLLDKVDMFIISDNSQRESQFRAGRIDGSTSPQSPPSVPGPEARVQFKREVPGMQMILDPTLPFGNGAGTWMDYRPGSPWLDVRLRRGLSMLIDRNLYIDTFLNVSGFQKDGIDVGEMQWHSHLNAPLKEFWLDPQKPAPVGLGEVGKFWKFDPAEARKLVSAAHALPVTGPFNKLSGNEYAPPYHKFAEVMLGMYNEGGIFKLTNNPVDYTTEFTPKMSVTGNPDGGHNFEGLAFGSIGGVTGGYSDPEATWSTHFTPGGTMYKFEKNFIDQRFVDLNQKQAREMDEKKRIELVKETQRVLADWFPMILFPGLVKGVTLYQPWHGNAGATISRNNEAGGWNAHLKYRWLDKSKITS